MLGRGSVTMRVPMLRRIDGNSFLARLCLVDV